MFFYLSKAFWFFIQPLNLAIFLLLAGAAFRALRLKRTGGAVAAVAVLLLVLCAWTSLGALMLNPLEERFARPAQMPAHVEGVVVLGGGFEGAINLVRGGYDLNSGGDRFVEAAVLARRFPDARVLVSGGTGTIILEGEGDADTAPRLLVALGVDPSRLLLENHSRNTFENAQFSREMADPKPGETWLLVTSAFHMPRSVGLFRKAGFDVVPWPVDYRTSGAEGIGLFRDNPADSLQTSTMAIREWIGLVAYRAAGRIDQILPGPD